MKVLVLYQLHSRNDRNTIDQHLYSFERYSSFDIHYYNVFREIPIFLTKINYDAVIFHYTFLASERFLEDEKPWNRKIENVNLLSGFKIALPQDEYDHTERLCNFFEKAHVDKVYTCFNRNSDIEFAYKRNINRNIIFEKTFTGFVDENAVKKVNGKLRKYKDRKVDIGYRARKLPAYFGRHGQLKYELVTVLNSYLSKKDLIYDINSTNSNYSNEDRNHVKLGDSWIEFLMNCKAFIGCEGGSSLLDYDGSIKKKVLLLNSENPNLDFDEIEKICFPNQDFNIRCFALSPRHFECAITKTLQILVEGDYGGVFKSDIHYLPLKKDFSNLDEVLAKLQDKELCQQIVDKAYDDIVLSHKYTYKKFTQDVFSSLNIDKKYSFDLRYKVFGLYISIWNKLIRNINVMYKIIGLYYASKRKAYLYLIDSNPRIEKVYRVIKNYHSKKML